VQFLAGMFSDANNMRIQDLEDADQLVTKDFLRAELKNLQLGLQVYIQEQIIASERSTRSMVQTAYALIFGTYALIIAAIFVNHFWK
jgi:hypothetical protein